jgi:hypothetical protein
MMRKEITNEDIIKRLESAEKTVGEIKENLNTLTADTKDMVAAFKAASGAFAVLEWLAKVAKPVIIIVAAIGSAVLWFKGLR